MLVRLELSEKFLPLPKHGDILLNYMTQTRERWDSHVLNEPVFHDSLLFFLSRTNVGKEHLDESNFYHCYDNFFESAIRKIA